MGNLPQPTDIGAGLEVAAIALQHDDAQVLLATRRIHRIVQALQQVAIVGIVDGRTVERDRRHAAAIDVEQDGVVAHAQSAFR